MTKYIELNTFDYLQGSGIVRGNVLRDRASSLERCARTYDAELTRPGVECRRRIDGRCPSAKSYCRRLALAAAAASERPAGPGDTGAAAVRGGVVMLTGQALHHRPLSAREPPRFVHRRCSGCSQHTVTATSQSAEGQ